MPPSKMIAFTFSIVTTSGVNNCDGVSYKVVSPAGGVPFKNAIAISAAAPATIEIGFEIRD